MDKILLAKLSAMSNGWLAKLAEWPDIDPEEAYCAGFEARDAEVARLRAQTRELEHDNRGLVETIGEWQELYGTFDSAKTNLVDENARLRTALHSHDSETCSECNPPIVGYTPLCQCGQGEPHRLGTHQAS